jgi:hypothetical protein
MATMQRWELSAFGRENLSLVSVPRPVPGADEVLVEVEAVSLNFRDSLYTVDLSFASSGHRAVALENLAEADDEEALRREPPRHGAPGASSRHRHSTR